MTNDRIWVFLAVLGTVAFANRAAAQSIADGEAYFGQHCHMCHTNAAGARDAVGPNLFGVANRKAGSKTGYNYSSALKNSKLVWNQKTLDSFLTTPGALVPGTMMVVSVPDAAQRKDLVAYLMSLKK
jgi:cytochrome c